MGVLRSKTNREGLVVNGVLLGLAPLTLADGSRPAPQDTTDEVWFTWTHEAFVDGIVRADGVVIEDDQ